jgi:hypothetical protein
MGSEKRYSSAEARAILQRAEKRTEPRESSLAARAGDEGLSPSEIIETARELGISEQQAALALREHDEDRELVQAEAELKQLAGRRVFGHAIAFSVTQALLALFGVWSLAPRPLWLLVTTTLWVGGLLWALRAAWLPDPDQLRERAKARLLRRRLKASTREFGEAVQSGAAKLLSVSAKKIDEGVERLTQGAEKKEKP